MSERLGYPLIKGFLFLFFFNDTATTEIDTLSLHDALPISVWRLPSSGSPVKNRSYSSAAAWTDRKSTRLNSSHQIISYAVFCLKHKKTTRNPLCCRKKNNHDRQTTIITLRK